MASRIVALRKGGGAQRAPNASWTPAKRNRFLARLAETLNVRASVRSVGLSESGLYKLRRRDAAFAAAWDQTIVEAYGKVEMLLLERALIGAPREVGGTEADRPLETLSERALLALANQHRQIVRDLRAAAERAESSVENEAFGARDRLVAKLAEIERLAVEDGE